MSDIETATKTCSLCGDQFTGWGNNPAPLADLQKDGSCCDTCNQTKVIPARLSHLIPPGAENVKVDSVRYNTVEVDQVLLANADYGRGKTNLTWDQDQ